MRKTLGGLGIVVLSVLLLVGCNEQPDAPPVPQPDTASEETDAPEGIEAEGAVEPLEVTIATEASLRSDRRLMITGEANLPDRALVQVTVERELSRVRWQARTSVTQGQFEAGPFGSGSGLPDGGYIVHVRLSEASVQPRAVQERIGSAGEHLSGELVNQSRHGLGQVATYSRRFLVGSEPRRTRDQVDVVVDVVEEN